MLVFNSLQEVVAEWSSAPGPLRVETNSAESHGAEHLPKWFGGFYLRPKFRSFRRSVFDCVRSVVVFVCSSLKPQTQTFVSVIGRSSQSKNIDLHQFEITPLSKMEPSPEQGRAQPHHHETHVHTKNVKKGAERLDRRSTKGYSGQPKKSGHGGKFTWDGPTAEEDYTEDDAVLVLDDKDPNYVDEQQEAEDKKVAVNAIEIPKVTPVGVARKAKEPVAS